MKLKLQFIIATFIALVIYCPVAHGQANLTFSGGNGTPLSITLQQSVAYTITGENCLGAGNGPIFVIDEVGNVLSSSLREATGTITYSINGGSPLQLDTAQGGFTLGNVTVNDLYLYGSTRPGVALGSTVVFSAGTITTTTNVAAAPPAAGSYATFIVNSSLTRCSSNGVALVTTAAPISVSGRVTTTSGKGIRNVSITMTDSNGNERTATTTSFGYYRFETVEAGETVTLTAKARRFRFNQSSIVRTTNESISDADFISEQ